ncbi:MAG: RNA polymerase sigma factor RpoH [Pseudomonadota bacterium]
MSKDLVTAPALTPEGSLSRYLSEIRKFPMLEKDQEYMLAKRFSEHEDTEAAQQLITSHLRLVAKIAMGYRGYGLPIGEVISEGNVGLMQAVKRFDAEKGFRLATYAMWWIRASIQEYILRSWSLVKIGTTAAQKKLFFNLRKIKGQIDAVEEGDLRPEQVEHIATKLGVSEDDVVSMNRRMSGGEASLNAPLGKGEEGGGEWQDWLVDDNAVDAEQKLAHDDEYEMRMGLLRNALGDLNEREQHILNERRLKDNPATLEELSKVYNVSRERIRQIEVRAFEKLQKAMKRMERETRAHTIDAAAAPA